MTREIRSWSMLVGVMGSLLGTCPSAFAQTEAEYAPRPQGESEELDSVDDSSAGSEDTAARRLPPPTSAPFPGGVSFVQTIPNRADEHERLTRQIYALDVQRQELSLGGPIALLATGGAIAVLGASSALLAAVSCSRWSSASDCRPYAGVAVAAGAIGGGMALAGGIWLGSRGSQRRALSHQIEELEIERGVIEHGDPRTLEGESRHERRPALTVTGLSFDPTRRAVFLSGSF